MSMTPKFKVVDEYGITQHIGPKSSCEQYRMTAYSLHGMRFSIKPMGSL